MARTTRGSNYLPVAPRHLFDQRVDGIRRPLAIRTRSRPLASDTRHYTLRPQVRLAASEGSQGRSLINAVRSERIFRDRARRKSYARPNTLQQIGEGRAKKRCVN